MNQGVTSNQKLLLIKNGKITLKKGGGGASVSIPQQKSNFCNKLEVRQVLEQARGFLSLMRGLTIQ